MILHNVRILKEGVLVKRDVEIENGIYTKIEEKIEGEGKDMEGCYLLPGLCDIHVHFRQPGFEKKETIFSGSRSAAKGGYTTVFAMPNLNPVPDCLENLKVEEEIIQRDSLIETIPYGSVTKGEKGEEVSDIETLKDHTRYFSDDGVGFHNLEVLKKALVLIKKYNLFLASHAEDSFYKTKEEGEYLQVRKEIQLAKEIGIPYHFCHMSTKESFDSIREAQKEGLPITCEVTPHHLFLNRDDIKNGNFKMNPPLRSKRDQEETLKALLDGTCNIIASDHAPHTKEEKEREYEKCPNGIIGLETTAPLVYTNLVKKGLISYQRFEDILSNNPRRLMGLKPLKIEVGKEATCCCLDILSLHTYEEKEILSQGKNSPFLGKAFYGFNVLTIFKGKAVYVKE